jgi:excisionase family DNA binding protein
MSAWTRETVAALGPTTDVATMASILGISSETIYHAIRRGDWTATRVLRLGRKIKIPTLDLIRLLFAPDEGSTPAIPGVPTACHHVPNGQVNGRESQSQCGCGSSLDGAVLPLRATS